MEAMQRRIEASRNEAREQERFTEEAAAEAASAREARAQLAAQLSDSVARTFDALADAHPDALRSSQAHQSESATRHTLTWAAEGPERMLVIDVSRKGEWVRWGWGAHVSSDQIPPEQLTQAELDRLVALLTDHNEWRAGGAVPESERSASGR